MIRQSAPGSLRRGERLRIPPVFDNHACVVWSCNVSIEALVKRHNVMRNSIERGLPNAGLLMLSIIGVLNSGPAVSGASVNVTFSRLFDAPYLIRGNCEPMDQNNENRKYTTTHFISVSFLECWLAVRVAAAAPGALHITNVLCSFMTFVGALAFGKNTGSYDRFNEYDSTIGARSLRRGERLRIPPCL